MTKKTKIITTFISLLAIIVLLVVLSSTLFAVKEVKVSVESASSALASTNENEIVEMSNIKNGANVFLLEKKKAKRSIEQNCPYIKVLNIETKFPNIVVIHVVERDEVFAFQTSDKCYITDGELKVLRIVDGEYSSKTSNAIKVLYDGDGAAAGEFLSVSEKFLPLNTMENSNYQNYSIDENALQDFCARYEMISVFEDKIVLQTFLGVKVCIYDPSYKQQEKLKMATIKMDSLTYEQKQKGTIIIAQSDEKVVGSYKENE